MRIVFDRKLNSLCHFGSGDLRGQGKGKVYAGGDARARHDSPGGDHALFGRLRAVGGKFVEIADVLDVVIPVGMSSCFVAPTRDLTDSS
jgi:hypothetical protein